MKTLFFICFVTVSFYSCYMDSRAGFLIDNESNETLLVYVGLGGGGALYPDTMLPNIKIRDIVPSYAKRYVDFDAKNIEKLYENVSSDTISVFILSQDTVNKYSWEDVSENYRILQRYDISLREAKMLKMYLTYPPSESMATIKMYPPYKR